MFLSRTSLFCSARNFQKIFRCLSAKPNKTDDFPSKCDIVICGGSVVGSSIAYHLKDRVGDALKIVVIERDRTYKKASTPLSNGGMRQQFSVEENILLSCYGAEFLLKSKQYSGDDVDVQFAQHGYLFLASGKDAETLAKLQNSLGAKNILLTSKQLKERFPWMNADDVALGKSQFFRSVDHTNLFTSRYQTVLGVVLSRK